MYETFNGQFVNNREGASERLDELIAFYKDCDLQIFREFAALLSKYHDSIVNSFRYVTASESGRYANKLRRLSNGPMESFNNIPSGYRTQSHGIDDFEFTRNRILWSYRKDAPIYGHTEKTHLFWLFPNQLLKYITIPAKNAVRTKKANTDQTTLHTIWTTRKGDVHRIYFL